MEIRIALAGNPNSGKTTLFNILTGSNQYVGNWPGVTVEKKEGTLKDHEGVIIVDLPGVYSLSPYTLEEVVARDYLVNERPEAILNIVDGTNLERNLYLTTQLIELGIPVVVAINMMDIVRKNGDSLDLQGLSHAFGCKVVEISALKGDGVIEAAEEAITAAKSKKIVPPHNFSGAVEHAIAHIEEAAVHDLPAEQQRWYAIKIFERDERVLKQLQICPKRLSHIEEDIRSAEGELDDDAESIIINDRYEYITRTLKKYYQRKNEGKPTTSDKIDKVLTNRFAALPIFAAIMFLVYYISVSTVGAWVTDFTNDGLFGEGFFFLGQGREEYEEASLQYEEAYAIINGFVEYADQNEISVAEYEEALKNGDKNAIHQALVSMNEEIPDDAVIRWTEENENYEIIDRVATGADFTNAIANGYSFEYSAPQTTQYGLWCSGVPVLVERGLEKAEAPLWLSSLVLNGIVGGVGAVLGFVPQILVLFIFLAFLESCGYMSRIAFVLDRIFRKFGLSGKSFIPLLIGSGCGVPGIMASRTIENENDRRMTIMTTTFIPCGAKLPIIAMITAAVFGGADKGWWLAPLCYFIGILAVIASGIMLKKTKMFSGTVAPFVMELPAYHMPTLPSVLRSMWERGWSFIKKAGTVILLSTIIIWAGNVFGVVNGSFVCDFNGLENGSFLEIIGGCIAWLFAPLGFAYPTAAVATLMGLVAKEEVVAVFGVADMVDFSGIAAFSFLVFNLLCAPCFAAMGAIRREMNSPKWTAFAITYQCLFAYGTCLVIYQFGSLLNGSFTGGISYLWLSLAVATVVFVTYMLSRKPAFLNKK